MTNGCRRSNLDKGSALLKVSPPPFPQQFSVHVHIRMHACSCMDVQAARVVPLDQSAIITCARKSGKKIEIFFLAMMWSDFQLTEILN